MEQLPSLLPPNTTPFQQALEQTIAARQALPAELVSAVLDPDRCPEHLLGFLAWDLSVDIWQDDWPVEKKRHVLRIAWRLHRLKTTPAGIKAHVALTGAEVVKIVRPPARGFLRGAMTEAQRIAWLEGLPQVRIYPFFRRDIVRPGHLFMSGLTGKRFWSSGRFLRPSRGKLLLGRHATYYDRGEEFPVRLRDPEGDLIERIHIPRTDSRRAFWGHGWHGRFFLTASTADQRVITVRPAAEGSGEIFAVPPGGQTTDVRPRRVMQRRTAPIGRSFWVRRRRFHGHGFLRESFGPQLVYDCYYIIDPARVGARQKVLTWHGHGQYGIDPFTAKLRVRVPMQRPRSRAFRWHGNGFLKAADLKPMWRAIEAVSLSKALRDKILIDTTTRQRAQFGSGLRFGNFTFGEIRKVT
ncbi:MAG: phage tail protein I [Novosphingobium sp.]